MSADALFSSIDTDGSGTISKRELITVLRSMGLKDMKNALQLFDGFDADGNAELCAAAGIHAFSPSLYTSLSYAPTFFTMCVVHAACAQRL